ncbi:MAG: FHA domain-containing protein [Spirochaetales bacterium]|nr:MAG: FHA domain-containing protein [Spirochaetales bacterium]
MGREFDTICGDSNLGKRLSKIQKKDAYQLSCNGKAFPIATRISIGRSPDSQIVLDDSMVSRHHAVVQKIKDDYFITDLDSRNGTFVNGLAVPKGKYLKLRKRDVIVIGRTELKVF